jgi:hypothetical protein
MREVVQNLILKYPSALREVESARLSPGAAAVNGLPEKIINVGNAAKAPLGSDGSNTAPSN